MAKLYKAKTAFHTQAPSSGRLADRKQRAGVPVLIRAGDVAEEGSWPVEMVPDLFEELVPDYPAPEPAPRKQEKAQESRKSGG